MKQDLTVVNNNRYDWVDVLKALGIIAIYYGHCIHPESRLHLFFFTYHVPLFFFAAGFFAVKENRNFESEETLWQFIIKKFKHIMVPYLLYSAIFVVIYAIGKRKSLYDVLIMIKQVAFGIRNQLPADSLWFLTCIFSMSIMYEMMYRTFKTKSKVLFYSFVLFSMTQVFFPFNPLKSPSWFMNIDSALYYLIYYALGAFLFQYIRGMSYKTMEKTEKIFFIIITIVAIILAGIVYYKDPDKMLDDMFLGRFSRGVFVLVVAVTMIYLNVLLSHILSKIKCLQVLGTNTLILCGTEQILKVMLTFILVRVGLNVNSQTYKMGAVFTLICFVVSYFVVIPVMSKIMSRIMKFINKPKGKNIQKEG